jgi:conjugation system TraG family ATPase
MLGDYRRNLDEREIKVSREDFNIDNMLTTLRQYYKGGRFDFLLNSAENIDLLNKSFIVFEIDQIKENKELFPVVTIIIMEAFIGKLRRLKGVRKQLIVEEAWKALSSANMAAYMQYMYKTVRKYFGEAIVVTQEVDDIIFSPIVKEAIINNSDCKILLDQRKFMNRFDVIQSLLGLTEKEKGQILSINMANNPGRNYKEVWFGLGGVQSAVYATDWGEKPKDGEAGDCYLIDKVNGNLCVRMGIGYVYLSYDNDRDVLKIHPGGEYTRTGETKK